MTSHRIETLAEGVTLYPDSDCLDALKCLDANSVDSCVTDPPYHLTAGKNGGTGPASLNENSPAGRARISTGFMGKAWDGGDIAFRPEIWAQVLRVLKPGAHLLAFGGTRTYHRMACAIEDAGFEIRDSIQWLYGSGFPKSLDVSKAIDKAAGAERTEVIGRQKATGNARGKGAAGHYANALTGVVGYDVVKDGWDVTAPETNAAKQWSGFGTALKPACEPIVLARKPLSESTVAANVLKWGTGALNIDGCRVGVDGGTARSHQEGYGAGGRADQGGTQNWRTGHDIVELSKGRWPANVIHDGSDEVVGAFPETKSGLLQMHHQMRESENGSMSGKNYARTPRQESFGDEGSAARFFYAAKADADDRLGSKHPTVKPLDLMQYLCRLVCPPKGIALDPFAGTGTTGEACIREGFRAILIEREAEYCDDIRRHMRLAMCGPAEREREAIKARMKDKPVDHGSLFGAQLP